MTDEQHDASYQEDERESSSTEKERDAEVACGQDEERFQTHRDGDADSVQPSFSSRFADNMGQKNSDLTVGHRDSDNYDDFQGSAEDSTWKSTEVRKLDSIDEHSSSNPPNILMSEYLSNLPGPPPQERLPPSERYKPRPPLKAVPARPSLTRAPATYDGRPTGDSERKSAKRVSFQRAPTPLYTPPSTTTSSPVSPSASPQLPFRTILAKPPPASIPPGQYTPVASSSPVSPLFPMAPPTVYRPYTCLDPTCDSTFDHPYDRDRHERRHEIGDPPYSECPVCHHSRSSGAAVEVGLREMLIAHMKRRHKENTWTL